MGRSKQWDTDQTDDADQPRIPSVKISPLRFIRVPLPLLASELTSPPA